jgi:hypothetical protein
MFSSHTRRKACSVDGNSNRSAIHFPGAKIAATIHHFYKTIPEPSGLQKINFRIGELNPGLVGTFLWLEE